MKAIKMIKKKIKMTKKKIKIMIWYFLQIK